VTPLKLAWTANTLPTPRPSYNSFIDDASSYKPLPQYKLLGAPKLPESFVPEKACTIYIDDIFTVWPRPSTTPCPCDHLWEGCRESRRCSRDTYPESYITKYTSIRRLNSPGAPKRLPPAPAAPIERRSRAALSSGDADWPRARLCPPPAVRVSGFGFGGWSVGCGGWGFGFRARCPPPPESGRGSA